MRTHRLFASRSGKVARHGMALAAAISFLAFGALAVPSQLSAAPSLSARLAAATRVAQQDNGSGYWLVSSDGNVTAFGSAHLYGSMAGKRLTAPIIGIVATADGRGYWLVAKDGGVFSFGNAPFAGSLGSKNMATPIVGMASSSGSGSAAPGARGPQGLMGPAGPPGTNGTAGLAGSDGLMGPQGLAGANGTNGATGGTGANGTNGTNGATGGTGANGTNGAVGGTGATGGTGPQGPSSGANYAYVYNTSAQTVAIATAINFDVNGPMSGFSHSDGSPAIVALVTGTYSVDFSVSAVEPNQFAVFVNGVVVLGGTFGSGAGTQVNEGGIILNLAAGDVIILVNHTSAAAVTLQTLAGGTAVNVNAKVRIEQLG